MQEISSTLDMHAILYWSPGKGDIAKTDNRST